MARENNSPKDPMDPDAVDREIRINELTERVKELGVRSMHVGEDCPPDAAEEFLRGIIDYETAPLTSHFERLVKAGVDMPEPTSLDDAALSAKLWEVINALAAADAYLYRTNHLSDRQLYEQLWSDTLREEIVVPPGPGWHCHIDLLGGCSEKDIEMYLRYYDSEEERQNWAGDFPDHPIPPHEDPPFDRDRHLPAAP